MTFTSQLTFNFVRLNTWARHNPAFVRAAVLALALVVALAAVALNVHLAWACPLTGGCGG